MSAARQIRAVDFRRRRATPLLRRPVAQWQERICTLASEAWGRYLGYAVQWQPWDADAGAFADLLPQLPDPGLGITLQLGDPPLTTFWTFSQQHVLALVGEMLGTSGETDPESRPLTVVENSMAQLLATELTGAISEAWPGRSPIACRAGEVDHRPARSRLYSPQEKLLVLRFRIGRRAGDETCSWLVPQAAFDQIVLREWPDAPAAAPTSQRSASQHLEAIAGAMPMTLAVRLGEAQLPMSQLANLQVGDVIVLNRSIRDTLEAHVQGVSKFTGSPGRIGSRQSYRVDGMIDSKVMERRGEQHA